MNNAPQTYYGAQSAHRYIERNLSKSQVSLQQALRTLCAFRERYAVDHARYSDARSLTVHVTLGYSDMCWITAAIEALEKSIAGSAAESERPHKTESVTWQPTTEALAE